MTSIQRREMSSPVDKIAGNVPIVMAKVFESVKEATGIDLSDIVRAESYDARVNRNIDLKGFTQKFYDKLGGSLETVKGSIRLCAERCHVEVTTLVIPGENDTHEEMDGIAGWLASLNPDIPLHVSQFFPRYRMGDKPLTPVETVYALAETARKHLRYVYEGNC